MILKCFYMMFVDCKLMWRVFSLLLEVCQSVLNIVQKFKIIGFEQKMYPHPTKKKTERKTMLPTKCRIVSKVFLKCFRSVPNVFKNIWLVVSVAPYCVTGYRDFRSSEWLWYFCCTFVTKKSARRARAAGVRARARRRSAFLILLLLPSLQCCAEQLFWQSFIFAV